MGCRHLEIIDDEVVLYETVQFVYFDIRKAAEGCLKIFLEGVMPLQGLSPRVRRYHCDTLSGGAINRQVRGQPVWRNAIATGLVAGQLHVESFVEQRRLRCLWS